MFVYGTVAVINQSLSTMGKIMAGAEPLNKEGIPHTSRSLKAKLELDGPINIGYYHVWA